MQNGKDYPYAEGEDDFYIGSVRLFDYFWKEGNMTGASTYFSIV